MIYPKSYVRQFNPVLPSNKHHISIRSKFLDGRKHLLRYESLFISLTLADTTEKISGGGHALNPGFSSTTGIHISMSKFTSLNWNREEETIDIGAGLRWDHLYDYLNPQGHTVIGGRVRGVGVAGFILGGGISRFLSKFDIIFQACQAFRLKRINMA